MTPLCTGARACRAMRAAGRPIGAGRRLACDAGRVAPAVDPDLELELAATARGDADLDALLAHLSAAIRGFTDAGRTRDAAMACARLGEVYANLLNQTAARAWFARATRLIASEPPCIEQGWIAVAAMGCDVDDPAELLAKAELALDQSPCRRRSRARAGGSDFRRDGDARRSDGARVRPH
jgi:hypothetical protein